MCVCVRACVRAYVRACVRACAWVRFVCVCVRVCVPKLPCLGPPPSMKRQIGQNLYFLTNEVLKLKALNIVNLSDVIFAMQELYDAVLYIFSSLW